MGMMGNVPQQTMQPFSMLVTLDGPMSMAGQILNVSGDGEARTPTGVYIGRALSRDVEHDMIDVTHLAKVEREFIDDVRVTLHMSSGEVIRGVPVRIRDHLAILRERIAEIRRVASE